MLKVEHLIKNYGKYPALKDISFTLHSGKVYGLLGPNGAGKSTTMNIITGYIGATSGTVTLDGYDLSQDPEKVRGRIGYLPEIPPLYPDMTIREYLRTTASLKKIPAASARTQIRTVMDDLMLSERQNTLIRFLSKGYRQRVGIAQALLGDPQVIILDEPTVGLDPIQIQQFRGLIRKLGTDHTVVLSSHILQEISAVCDELLILRKGELIAQGRTADLAYQARGKIRMQLLAEGSEQQIRGCLSGVSGIQSVSVSEEEQDGRVLRVRLEIEDGKDIRRPLFYAFCENRIPLLEIGPAVRTLEDVFLDLTESCALKGGNG